jgi:hypothetical protein
MLESLLTWLNSHSTSVVRDGAELRFHHHTGSTSILVVRDAWIDGILPAAHEDLSSFYADYWAGSIGDGHVVIGTPIAGGIDVSHGYRIPDLAEMAATAAHLGLPESAGLEVFMQKGSWLFIYGLKLSDNVLFLYDHEFGDLQPLSGIEAVLNQWWEIELADAAEQA